MADPVILPPLKWHPSPNYSQRRTGPVRLIVVHRPVGGYNGSIVAMSDRKHAASAHAIVREDGKEATQLVAWDAKAWACSMFNSQSDSIETPDLIWTQPLTDKSRRVMQVCARVVAFRLQKRGLPATWIKGADILNGQGFTRHLDLGRAGGGHSDPTDNIPRWLLFADMVEDELERGGFRKTWGRTRNPASSGNLQPAGAVPDLKTEPGPEVTQVEEWRRRCFQNLGFTLRESRLLAERGADHHQAEQLLHHGCPPRTAYHILR